MANYIKQYYQKIESGDIVASKRVRKQYKKLLDDMEHHDKYIYDESKAERPIAFIERFCRH
ncbi:terminase large subunit, partial [Staphylococcus coagulans]|nr:terminase large subunit [Staphylococcus coagulans]MBT2858752.1 terminase large subunit [Staphylococcus coagulans]